MKRVSQAPWFIVLCVSISDILSEIISVSCAGVCRLSRAGCLSLSGLARARVKSDARARLALGARRPPRGRAVADQLSLQGCAS